MGYFITFTLNFIVAVISKNSHLTHVTFPFPLSILQPQGFSLSPYPLSPNPPCNYSRDEKRVKIEFRTSRIGVKKAIKVSRKAGERAGDRAKMVGEKIGENDREKLEHNPLIPLLPRFSLLFALSPKLFPCSWGSGLVSLPKPTTLIPESEKPKRNRSGSPLLARLVARLFRLLYDCLCFEMTEIAFYIVGEMV